MHFDESDAVREYQFITQQIKSLNLRKIDVRASRDERTTSHYSSGKNSEINRSK